MKPEEFLKNLLFTVTVILLCGVFVSLFIMSLLIQADETMPMSNIWAIGIVVFFTTTAVISLWTIKHFFPAVFSAARKARRSNPYSFSAIAKRRIKRRFAAAKRHRRRAQPARTIQYRQSFGSANRLIQKQF